jgi:hypothetical protein
MICKILRLAIVTISVATAGQMLRATAQQPSAPQNPAQPAPAQPTPPEPPPEPKVIDIEKGETGLEPVRRAHAEAAAPTATSAPDGSAELGKPARFTIDVGDRRVRSITATEETNAKVLQSRGLHDTPKNIAAKIVDENGTQRTMEIVPVEPGALDVVFYVNYADGTMVQQTRTINVSASPKGLTKFYILSGAATMSLVVGAKDADRQGSLSPQAYYTNLKYPVMLTSLDGVRLSVVQSQTAPAIHLDSDGTVHGLRMGKAVITATFGGMKDSVTVMVSVKPVNALDRMRGATR